MGHWVPIMCIVSHCFVWDCKLAQWGPCEDNMWRMRLSLRDS